MNLKASWAAVLEPGAEDWQAAAVTLLFNSKFFLNWENLYSKWRILSNNFPASFIKLLNLDSERLYSVAGEDELLLSNKKFFNLMTKSEETKERRTDSNTSAK